MQKTPRRLEMARGKWGGSNRNIEGSVSIPSIH